jgi:PAS domain S-box-containing protein
VLNRQLTLWESYKWYIISGISLILLEALLIGGLVWQRARRKKAETDLAVTYDRLRLAVEAGKSVGWDWDVQSGRDQWFGDLQTMFGIPVDSYSGHVEDFRRSIHSEDRELVWKAVADARQSRKPYIAEFRVVRADGSMRWITARGKFHYAPNGDPERMLGMAVDITDRKLAEEAVRESEDRLQLLLESTAEAIYGIDLEHRCTFCNRACVRTLGYERTDQVLGKNMHDLLHHSRADGTLFPVGECRVHRVTQTGEGVHAEDEVFWRANGTSFPTEYWSYPQRRGHELVGAVVAFIDITERKLAEAALADVSRRLIEAHEQERTRIGRDLHDDVVQRLALLAIELEGVQQDVPDAASELRTRIGGLRDQTKQITNDVQLLSHELHSSKLEYLGIVGAAKNFCKEFSERQKVEIDFQSHDVPPALPTELSLSLFRVLQEALRNATKHSGVKRFEVGLWESTGEIHLTVRDLGAGFDAETALKSTGLGLTSMQERLRLVGGELSINSQPKGGTTIHARVRFDSSSDSARAAG